MHGGYYTLCMDALGVLTVSARQALWMRLIDIMKTAICIKNISN